MANETTKKPATEVSGASKNFFEKYGEAATQRNIVGSLLKFTKFGEYRAGQEEREVPRGTPLAACMTALEAGYVRWEDGRPVEFAMGPIGEGFIPPKRSELGHLDQSLWDTFDDGRPRDPWQFSNSLVMTDLETEELYTFSTSSKGGLGAIGELAKVYGKHIRLHPAELPVVELDVGSYLHKDRSKGEIRFPVFKVTSWVPADKLPAIDGSNDGNGSGGEAQQALALPEAAPPPPDVQAPLAPKPTPRPAVSAKKRGGF
jgi:hypothetical protein